MNQVRLRLIHPASISLKHIEVARSGLRSLGEFGVLVECARASEKAFDDVRFSDTLRKVAYADSDVVLEKALVRYDSRSVFGIAFTPHYMTYISEGKAELLAGLGGYLKCAAVSLPWPLRFEDSLREDAIASAVKYEAGHLLIPGRAGAAPDCPNDCIMQRNPHFSDFVKNIVGRGIDFCDDCRHAIEETIRRRCRSLN